MKKYLLLILLIPTLLFSQSKYLQKSLFLDYVKMLKSLSVNDSINCDSIGIRNGQSIIWLSPLTISKLGGNLGYTAENVAHKDQINGYPSLNSSGVIPSGELPGFVINHTYTVANKAALLALSANVGDVAIRTDSSFNYILRQTPSSIYNNWTALLFPLTGIQSINGLTGSAITITSSTVGLGNLTNNIQVNKVDSNKLTPGGYETPKDVNYKLTLKEPAITSGTTSQFLRGDKTFNQVSATHAISDSLPIANGGTGHTYANAALNALLPSQTGKAYKSLQTNGTNTSWQVPLETDPIYQASTAAQISAADTLRWNNKQNYLGLPSVNGYILSMSLSGVPSWIAPSVGGGSMTWPTGGDGIAHYNGSSGWGTSYSNSNKIPTNFIPQLRTINHVSLWANDTTDIELQCPSIDSTKLVTKTDVINGLKLPYFYFTDLGKSLIS